MEKPRPFWLLPNLLSLDAPIVAIVWAWMFAQTWRVQWVNANVYYLLGGIVWIIYVLDRFLDNQTSNGARAKISSRHAFHAQHWTSLKPVVFIILGFCLAMVIQLPLGIFWHAIPVLILVSIYFFLALLSGGQNSETSLFKNMIAGLTFSFGVALGIHFFRPSTHWLELIINTQMWVFAILCMCNITAIDVWEASRSSVEKELKGYYEISLTIPLLLLVAFSLFQGLTGDDYAKPFYFSIIIAAGLLQIINKNRRLFSLDALRGLADLALIAPAPVFWAYYQYLN